MEEDEIQAQHKFPRVENEEENHGRRGDGSSNLNRFNSWHHSSRIIRVSRASGGKDRHSKVMTSKGLRDRRVRLSVTTAIQFYDLQDRLGYDQPSKAVEWLIKSASDAISELPSLNNSLFSDDTPNEQGVDSAHDAEMVVENGENNYQSQNLSLSKSGCSSTSETSKGSGLSLSRSDVRVSRVKARERARERTAKEKEKENHDVNPHHHHHHQHQQHHNNVNSSISQTASFTELLTGGINNTVPNTNSPRGSAEEPSFFNKARQQQQHQLQQQQQWSSSAPMDHYFSPGTFLGTSSSSRTHQQHHHLLGHSLHDHQSMTMSNSVSPFNTSGENHSQDQHQFSFIPDHMMQNVVTSSSTQPSGNNNNDYNLNFTISSGLAGYNRGTLQSNSPSLLSHLPRFSVSPLDHGSNNNLPFFMGGGGGASASSAPASAPTTMENNHHHHQIQQHQFSSVFDGSSLQLYSDQKGKPNKN